MTTKPEARPDHGECVRTAAMPDAYDTGWIAESACSARQPGGALAEAETQAPGSEGNEAHRAERANRAAAAAGRSGTVSATGKSTVRAIDF